MPEAPARRDETERLAAEPRPAPRARVAAPPARRPAPRSSVAPALPGLLHRAGAVLRHPAGVVGTLLGIGAVAAVATNALTFQSGRHPAPLFAKAPPIGAAGKAASDRSATGRSSPAAPSREAAAATGEPARAAKPAPDGIGDLIRGDTHTTAALPGREPAARPAPPKPDAARTADKGSDKAPARPPAAQAAEVRALAAHAKANPAAAQKPAATSPDKDVAFAQRALVKLGYGPLAVDGVIGPGTRAALDRFERDRRLTGVSRGTLRELAARSGLTPE
ncbi:peptidoglycan-binding domain-containing protein [uncultured Methylobacterium sp.]|jgi:hypothetical protein|uniref:peptidoglycan-binding domain-containing protein n=1 Tax=uncultured Methylobacterium sp. TaxID=157278 RepID=UPI002619ECF4|nr:peptidoglycan-binding domain-containing protein [uncultured Methylobacterium sp.]